MLMDAHSKERQILKEPGRRIPATRRTFEGTGGEINDEGA